QLEQLPSVADLAERLLPSVVEISVQTKSDTGSPALQMPDLPDNSPFKDFFDEFLKKQRKGETPEQQDRSVSSMGSGFVVDVSGLIVTNNHVVEGAESIEVHFQDSTILKAELVGRDPKTDLAVLRVKSETPLPVVAFGDSDILRIGEWVMAIGNPFGLGGSVSLGIVSARNRDINAGPYDDFIQTDAAINKGNSGGPLFNLKGEVVGINTAIFSPTGGSVGIGFSVPANTAKGVVDQLVKFGETRRGWFGVKIQSVTDDIAESMAMGKARGALIADVTKTGPAEKAGIEPGDVVIEFNGKPVNAMRDLPRIVADTEIGKKVPIKIFRNGKELQLMAEVGRLEDGEKVVAQQDSTTGGAPAPAVMTALGMTVSSMTDELRQKYTIDAGVEGAVVTEVTPDSTAADKNLAPGDVIIEAGEKAVTGAADISAGIDEAEKAGKNFVLFMALKGGKKTDRVFIALKLKK
ncbi:MAG: DegQ family serine endoprotease, partial [Aestuariivirga sp.]|nr:DegQ family serine endoprotease [Aestuariivirga sp.]